MNRIKSQKIEDFLKSLSSSSPTPGGGAVAALAGALAVSLVEMVTNLTREKILDVEKITQIRKELLRLADEDCQAFDAVMTAYKSKSKQKIRKSLVKAIEVPERVMVLSAGVEKLAFVTIKKGNKNAVSDAKSALHLARAARKSAEENIKINKKALASLK
ncbi:MAG: cyclodeaminase/cyclohydrolase family protein [Patescibacteria group bacterium]